LRFLEEYQKKLFPKVKDWTRKITLWDDKDFSVELWHSDDEKHNGILMRLHGDELRIYEGCKNKSIEEIKAQKRRAIKLK
jgi:hypothetical protein